MKYIISIIFIISLLVNPVCFAQENNESTGGLSNGRFWIKLNMPEKVSYIFGIMEFFVYHSNKDRGMEVSKYGGTQRQDLGTYILLFVPLQNNAPEMAEQLDDFYSDSANRTIPILVAMRIITQKFYGASEQTIKTMTETARSGDYLIFDDQK